MAKRNGIERRLQRIYNIEGLKKLEQKLQQEFSDILRKDELMWFQRSRTKWKADKYRNKRYYHIKIINRRRHNKITMLKNDHGVWLEHYTDLGKHVNEYYKKLF